MSYILNKDGNKAVFTLTIPKADVEAGMKHAAEHISEESSIPGFRPGKASYEVVKKRVGEMKLLEACAEELIRGEFVKAMLAENLDTVGQPFFETEKFAPGNDLVIKAEIALYPHVKKLADYKKLSIKGEDTKAKKEQLDQAKKDLALMQTKEVRAPKDSELKKGDKAIVNLTMKRDGVVLEGGEGKDHGIYTNEPHYIAGLVDNILGSKEGETKTFTLPFPEDHYQKHLAGQDVDFDVTINEIYHLESPDIDDAFAKTVGMKDAKELEAKISENIELENKEQESLRVEREVLSTLASKSTFEEIPDILVNQEVNKMMNELEYSIQSRGMDMEAYLGGIGKNIAELKLDFTPTALERIKAGIVLKEIIKAESIKLSEEELNTELDKLAEQYKEDKEAQKRVYEPDYRAYVETQLTNKKALDFLVETLVKKTS